MTVPKITDTIYGNLSFNIRRAAIANTKQALLVLEKKGKVKKGTNLWGDEWSVSGEKIFARQ
jgi:hypothetical protein